MTRGKVLEGKKCVSLVRIHGLQDTSAGKAKAHYIEVYLDNEGEESEKETRKKLRVVEEESLQGETPEGVIATLSEVPRFHTLRVREVV